MKQLGSFSITAQESMDFALASGDFNPLHIDPVAARRTRFGHTLIHGLCGTIKALDQVLEQSGKNTALLGIRVKYSKPVTQGQELTITGEKADGVTRLELFAGGIRCQVIDLELADIPRGYQLENIGFATNDEHAESCDDIDIDDCIGLSGTVDLLWDADRMRSLFPSAVAYLPAAQLASLVASTHVVGMRCPGLHSVFAQLDMRFATNQDSAATADYTRLNYSVINTDKRIDRVELDVRNAYVQGTVEAFFRPPPARQAAFRQIATMVSDREFSKQNALVIGGSRGLGEVITKVLAAGGANIMMTYAVGKEDAARVCGEIGEKRSAPEACFYNVLNGSLCDQMKGFCSSVKHIYYLASPTIAKGDSNRWDRKLFTQYCDFYIDGLATLLQQVIQCAVDSRHVQLFIPSSVFLEQKTKGFDEYIAAKAAAEAFVQCFEKTHRNWTVVVPRLPRLHTDQTSTIKTTDEQETLRVIIDQLRLVE